MSPVRRRPGSTGPNGFLKPEARTADTGADGVQRSRTGLRARSRAAPGASACARRRREPGRRRGGGGGRRARGDAGSAQALRARDRRRPPADGLRGARARPPQGRGRRGGQAEIDRVEPPARDVDHAQLHQGRRAAPRPDPGGQPRPDPRRREVRLQDGLQALDLRHLVDPPGGHPRARRAGPDDPPARARRRAGAPRHARPPGARAEAEPRPDATRRSPSRAASRPSASASCSSWSRIPSASRHPSATARASTAT